MDWLYVILVPLVIRICLVILFPFSALDKILDWNGAMAQAKSSFLPTVLAAPMMVAAIVVEFVAPFLIVIGWHDRVAAFILAGFCVVTALLYHNFWHYRDFWVRGDSRARAHFWDFLKNFGLVGGLLLVTFGTSVLPADWVARHAFSATPVYQRNAAPPGQENCGAPGLPACRP
ncbi:MAG TPA: DoxX family protein [Gammaproteobacteria bacterium]|nr:DoxX family protein [Gammaproteobacteria bacterium]